MPRMSGFELLLELKKIPRLQKIPVIVYSNAPEENIRQMDHLGVASFVKKPNSQVELQESIFKLIRSLPQQRS